MEVYKLGVFGLGAVGKTAITIQFLQGVFMAEVDPTIERYYEFDREIDTGKVKLDIIDTAGKGEYSMRDEYVREGKGFVLVYAIDDRVSFEQVEVFHRDLVRDKGSTNFSVVICGNKCDLEDRRIVSKAEGEELAERLKAKFFETSALTGLHIEDAFVTLVREIRKSSAAASRTSEENGSHSEKKGDKSCILL